MVKIDLTWYTSLAFIKGYKSRFHHPNIPKQSPTPQHHPAFFGGVFDGESEELLELLLGRVAGIF